MHPDMEFYADIENRKYYIGTGLTEEEAQKRAASAEYEFRIMKHNGKEAAGCFRRK